MLGLGSSCIVAGPREASKATNIEAFQDDLAGLAGI